MVINYNSWDTLYKKPFGAVRENENINFCITAPNGTYIYGIKILIQKDDKVFLEKGFIYKGYENSLHTFVCDVKIQTYGIYKYYFSIHTENGDFVGKNNNGKLDFDEKLPSWQLTVFEEEFQTPVWAKNTVMYQIFPDRFRRTLSIDELPKTKDERVIHEKWDDVPKYIYDEENYKANDYFFGSLKGIEEKLDYLLELGINIIYLNPIFQSGANHRYSTADYKNVDPYLGTNEDFSHLCSSAKKRNIKIILDGVFNHTGDDSIYFNKFGAYDSIGAYQSESSPYYKWYNFFTNTKGEREYECWWGFENLPNVNEENPDYLKFITDEKTGVIKFWNDLGADGWRLDVADELPDRFIDALRISVKKANPQALLIGEVWEDATTKLSYGVKRRYLLGKQLDSVMNYPFRTTILNFANGGKCENFIISVMTLLENYPAPSIDTLMNSISTHDTMRAITSMNDKKDISPKEWGKYKMSDKEYKKAREKLYICIFLQFSLPGIPCIYYGDEVGLEGYKDPYNRMGYPYGKEDFEIFEYHKSMIKIRNSYKDDFSKSVKFVKSKQQIVCFQRGNLVFIANNGDSTFFEIENISKKLFGFDDVIFNSYGVTMPPRTCAIMEKREN